MKSRLRVTLAALAILVLSAATAYAHTPMLYVEDMRDGTIYLEGGFSDGSSAAGVKIYLVEDALFKSDTAARDEYLEALFAIFRSQLDQYGELVLRKPKGKYLVVFDAGPGHVVVKKGPALTDAERKQSK